MSGIGTAILTLAGIVVNGAIQYGGQQDQNRALAAAGVESRRLADRDRLDRLRSEREQLGLARDQMGLSRARLKLEKDLAEENLNQWNQEFAHKKKYDRANHLMGIINNDLGYKAQVANLGFQRRKVA